jgi:lipopolysaccharide/colanic/teichoic acid biosynthesis glycosyltransferase
MRARMKAQRLKPRRRDIRREKNAVEAKPVRVKAISPYWRGPLESLLALILLVLCGPLLLLITGFSRITSEGPVFVTDRWLTNGGRSVRASRFRTTGPGLAVFGAVARVLRRYSVDELPALWNVRRGEVRFVDLSLFKLKSE